MADIVNLRMARKRKARAEKERAADENRILHGRPGNEVATARMLRERMETAHEAHRIEKTGQDDAS